MKNGEQHIRVTTTADERAVVVHLKLGRSQWWIGVRANAPRWRLVVEIPVDFFTRLTCGAADFDALVAAARKAADVYSAHFDWS